MECEKIRDKKTPLVILGHGNNDTYNIELKNLCKYPEIR